jgi:hypothetical protein
MLLFLDAPTLIKPEVFTGKLRCQVRRDDIVKQQLVAFAAFVERQEVKNGRS